MTEPVTMLTDYLLALAGAVFAFRTYRLRNSYRARPLWILAFISGAGAAAVGGTMHGFKLHFTEAALKNIWDLTMVLCGATAAFLLSATIVSSLRRREMPYVHWLKRGLILSAVGFAIQRIGWGIHTHFNHNDIYHMLQIAGFWCFFEGIRRMDKP